MDDFTKAYIEAALWSSTDDADEPLDKNYSANDLAPETLATMQTDCARFQTEQAECLAEDHRTTARAGYGCTVEESAGHDFWLTRCGHGAGFWDGDWEDPAASKLTDAAHAFGEVDLYIGDDGKVYSS
jgi:hypothetical protein